MRRLDRPMLERDLDIFELALTKKNRNELAREYKVTRPRIDQCIHIVIRDVLNDYPHVLSTPEGFYPGDDVNSFVISPFDPPYLDGRRRRTVRVPLVDYLEWNDLARDKGINGQHIVIDSWEEIVKYRDYWLNQIKQIRLKLYLKKRKNK